MAIYRAAIVTEVNSVATANVMHFQDTAPPASLSAEEGLNNWLTVPEVGNGFAEVWQALMSNEASITCVKIQKVSPAPLGTQRLFFSTLTGSMSDDALPSHIALVLSHQCNVGGGRGRGRNYFAGIPEEYATKGRLTATAFPIAEGLAARLAVANGNAANGSWQLNVYSKADDVFRDVVVSYPDPVLRNQRDRITNLCA